MICCLLEVHARLHAFAEGTGLFTTSGTCGMVSLEDRDRKGSARETFFGIIWNIRGVYLAAKDPAIAPHNALIKEPSRPHAQVSHDTTTPLLKCSQLVSSNTIYCS